MDFVRPKRRFSRAARLAAGLQAAVVVLWALPKGWRDLSAVYNFTIVYDYDLRINPGVRWATRLQKRVATMLGAMRVSGRRGRRAC